MGGGKWLNLSGKRSNVSVYTAETKTRNPPVKQYSYLKISWDYHPTEGLC